MIAAGPPTIDPVQLNDLKEMFPDGAAQLDAIAGLLEQPPTGERAAELFDKMREFSAATAEGSNDGEAEQSDQPGMLDPQRDPVDTLNKFADRLTEAGVELAEAAAARRPAWATSPPSSGMARRGPAPTHLLADEEPGRRGGSEGLGPAINELTDEFPNLRIHLIGHSFGARLVSYALAGLDNSDPSPIKSVTLLQGAYSRYAFTDALPFRAGAGVLAGRLSRIDGPLTVCFSSHDRALTTFYPLASMAAGDDAAAADDPLSQWRAMDRTARSTSRPRRSGRSELFIPSRRGRFSTWMHPRSSQRATPHRARTVTSSTLNSPG